MSVKKIIQESIDKNPLGVKEALEEALRDRVRLALEAKMSEEDDEDEDEDEDEDDDLDEAFQEGDKVHFQDEYGQKLHGHITKPFSAKKNGAKHAEVRLAGGMGTKMHVPHGQLKKMDESFDLSDLDEAVTGEKHISSGKAQHGLEGRAEMKAHADHMQKKHGVTTKFHGGANGDELSYHGPKANVKKAVVNHYDGDHEFAKEEHPHLWK